MKAILFDLGDTLIHFGRFDPAALIRQGAASAHRYLRSIGCELPPLRLFLQRKYLAMRWRVLISKLTRRDFSALRVLGTGFTLDGGPLSRQQMEELAWHWYLPLRNIARTEPNLRQTLQRLQNSAKLAIVSNTLVPGQTLDRHLQQERILEFFPVRIYSCQSGFRKPSRKIYQLALAKLAVEPRHAIFVGDKKREDIIGPRRLGMRTVFIRGPTNRRAEPGPADYVIDSIEQLPPIVERLANRQP